jgi:uncharacterized membrane protein
MSFDHLQSFLAVCLTLVAVVIFRWRRAQQKRLEALESRVAALEKEIRSRTHETAEPLLAIVAATSPAILQPQRTSAPPPHLKGVPTPAESPPRVPQIAAVVQSRPAPVFDLPAFSWEAFMGVKLFAWLGGLALFLGLIFFVKYSFENNLVTPQMRVLIGAGMGLALIGGGLRLPRPRFDITAQTLVATGVVTLYGVTFGAHSFYHLIGLGAAFGIMAAITAAAFLLAVRMDAQYVALLGLLGGFLTPALLSTGRDNAPALFTYIAFLDVGLIAITLRKRWFYLLLLAAIGTVLTQGAWFAAFFNPEKTGTAMLIFLGFEALFLATFWKANSDEGVERFSVSAAVLLAGAPLIAAKVWLDYRELGAQPWLLLSFALLGDTGLAVLPLRRPKLQPIFLVSGGAMFLILVEWTSRYLTDGLLGWALGFNVAFALLHLGLLLWVLRRHPEQRASPWTQAFPALALLLMLWPALRFGDATMLWFAVALLDLAAIAFALWTGSLLGVLAALALTFVATGCWLFGSGAPPSLAGLLAATTFFAAFFFSGTLLLRKRLGPAVASLGEFERDALEYLPALSTIFPFALLVMIESKLRLANPTPVFAVALLLAAVLLGLARWSGKAPLSALGLVCVLVVEHFWFVQDFSPNAGLLMLGWIAMFATLFAAFPFAFRGREGGEPRPWSVAALAWPLHYYLTHQVVAATWPQFADSAMGLLPALLALPMLAAVMFLHHRLGATDPARLSALAWFGGAALFFITLIFPVQFEREWLTISWALEGAALLSFFHRVPHPGLRLVGVGLLSVVFARLALNPAVLGYHERTSVPIFNWFLYTYGIAAACCFTGGALLAPPRDRIGGFNVRGLVHACGTLLTFLLLNIEIADYFATGPTVTFDFSGTLARDMTYSIAWALFALGLLLVGMFRQQPAVRYTGIGLFSITLLKLFLHDLANLNQLYRIGALIAVAVLLILASYFYQRFLTLTKPAPPESNPLEQDP